MRPEDFRFEITKLEWERVFLNLKVNTNYEGDVEFYLEHIDGTGRAPFPYQEKEAEGVYLFFRNITTLDGRQFLDNGRWRLVAIAEGKSHICCVTCEIAKKLEDNSRVFRYGEKYAYTITFGLLSEKEECLEFCMNSRFMKDNLRWKKRHYIEEARTVKGRIKNAAKAAVAMLLRAEYRVWNRFHAHQGNRILFMSETKDYLWGNMKFIDARLKERGLQEQFHISYSFEKAAGGEMNPLNWFGVVKKIAQQDYIFVDDYAPVFGFLNLDKRTKLIQVWHAGEGFKAVGYCRFGKAGSPFPAESCHKKYTHALTGSERLVKVYAEVFGIEEEAFLPVGMPRLDGFLEEQHIEEVCTSFYQTYPQWKEKKIILFAPTYRGKGQKQACYRYDWLDLKKIYDVCGDTYVFLVKMHPFIKEALAIPHEFQDRIFDLSSYKDINELYYVTDLLITDYSSNYYEYAILRKPVVFFTPDRENYEVLRGVHRGVKESAPGKVCDTFAELVEAIRTEDFEMDKLIQFAEENFKDYDGHASDRVIDEILLQGKER